MEWQVLLALAGHPQLYCCDVPLVFADGVVTHHALSLTGKDVPVHYVHAELHELEEQAACVAGSLAVCWNMSSW